MAGEEQMKRWMAVNAGLLALGALTLAFLTPIRDFQVFDYGIAAGGGILLLMFLADNTFRG